MRIAIGLLGVIPLLLGGCYGAKVLRQPVTVEDSARDLEAIRQQQVALEKRLTDLEKRSAEEAELIRSLKAEDSSHWDDLNGRLLAIDSKLHDALGPRAGYAANSPSYWNASPPTRAFQDTTRSLDPSGQMGQQSSSGAAAPDTSRFARTSPVNAEGDAKRVYDQAYLDLTRGNYSLAVLGFREFLKRSPQSDLADNAQYWVGECFYAQRDYVTAVQEFLKVQEQNPNGDKVPAALLKIGYSYLQLDDKGAARRYLNMVIEKYPNSDEAGLAKNKLRAAS
jgi:tol-pal system protein YbgF